MLLAGVGTKQVIGLDALVLGAQTGLIKDGDTVSVLGQLITETGTMPVRGRSSDLQGLGDRLGYTAKLNFEGPEQARAAIAHVLHATGDQSGLYTRGTATATGTVRTNFTPPRIEVVQAGDVAVAEVTPALVKPEGSIQEVSIDVTNMVPTHVPPMSNPFD